MTRTDFLKKLRWQQFACLAVIGGSLLLPIGFGVFVMVVAAHELGGINARIRIMLND